MANGYFTTADLSTMTGYERAADIAKCLKRQGIRYFDGKDGPWTTLELINAAGGLRQQANDGMYEGSLL